MATIIRRTAQYPEEVISDMETTEPKSAFTVYSIIAYIANSIEGILAIRLLLRLLGANTATPFVRFMNTISAPLVSPFRGIFANTQVNGSTIEWYTVIAMVAYAVIAYALIRLIQTLVRR